MRRNWKLVHLPSWHYQQAWGATECKWNANDQIWDHFWEKREPSSHCIRGSQVGRACRVHPLHKTFRFISLWCKDLDSSWSVDTSSQFTEKVFSSTNALCIKLTLLNLTLYFALYPVYKMNIFLAYTLIVIYCSKYKNWPVSSTALHICASLFIRALTNWRLGGGS